MKAKKSPSLKDITAAAHADGATVTVSLEPRLLYSATIDGKVFNSHIFGMSNGDPRLALIA